MQTCSSQPAHGAWYVCSCPSPDGGNKLDCVRTLKELLPMVLSKRHWLSSSLLLDCTSTRSATRKLE